MTSHTIGEITLSLSTSVYIIWLLPQLRLNFKRKSTEGLSFWLHTLLFLGYSSDLMYGFGLHMQWQYRMATIVGLCGLSVQHLQFGNYELKRSLSRLHYHVASIVILSLLAFSIHTIISSQFSRDFYNLFGMISNNCFLIYMLPQIIKNYAKQSTEGLSSWFVLLSILLGFCDITSAYTLQWSWPSLVGPFMSLLSKSVLLFQIYYYGRSHVKAAYA